MFGKKAITCSLGLLLTGYTANDVIKVNDSTQESQYYNGLKAVTHEGLFQISKRDSLEICLDSLYGFNERDLDKFNSWIDSTISDSKKNKSYAIIVNKSEYKLFLLKDGFIQKSFPLDLGFNPFDDKKMQGDRATPEGMYKVSFKIPEGKSQFYKGLLINYPNDKDKTEFNELIKSGKIPESSKIGGSIAIHGMGSGNSDSRYRYNWTHGCMALSNSNIDDIFDIVSLGTPVTIVKYSDKKLR